jgi:alpha-glucosidase
VTTSASSDRPWWTSAVIYQIYPRSFADGNGDGSGDLVGLRQRLDHLVELGVDGFWLSPFYPSPMADGGYDVADPTGVDPLFGTLGDFDAVLGEAHERGLKVLVDVVPNHFSDQHRWFQEALAAPPGSPERARFIFRPGRGEHGELPPNNWPSVFGGPAWHRVPDGEWYLHLFAPEQPDLDWSNPEVRAEFERIFRFWLDRGVDGFRIDVAHGLAKPEGLPDFDVSLLPRRATGAPMPSPHDIRWDREHVHDYHRALRAVLDSYEGSRMAVGETWVPDAERLARYVRTDELNLTFNFDLLQAEWGASSFREAIESALTALAGVGAACTWVLGNHDVERPVTRYGDGDLGVARARAAALVQLSLPGAAYLYNGEELGLPNVDLPDEALRDPAWERSGHRVRGRDGERVPMPWSGTEPPYGFTTAATTWLPMPPGWGPLTVAAQRDDPESTLALFGHALRLRRSLEALRTTELEWLDSPADTLAYRRSDVLVLLNTGPEPVPLPPGEVLVSSGPLSDGTLPTDTAVWLRG